MLLEAKRFIYERARQINNPVIRDFLRRAYARKGVRPHKIVYSGASYDPYDDGESELQKAFRSSDPYDVLDAGPQIVDAVDNVLVFMPTYAPDKKNIGLPPRPLAPLGHKALRDRCLNETLETPWLYLDAIDSIKDVLGPKAHLVVADFRSSDEIRKVLVEHQRNAKMPNYELWLSDEPESQWKAMNLVLMHKLGKKPNIKSVVYTSSDVIWWQASFLSECSLEFRKDFDAHILYPTMTRAENDVPYQQASLPRDMDSFVVDLCNAYVAVYNADFFRTFDNKYPDLFRNCFTESFLPMMLRAMGGVQKIVPRANCWHQKNADMWLDASNVPYAHSKELPVFTEAWAKLMAYKATKPWDASAIPFLKQLLYREPSYYESTAYAIYKEGVEVSKHKGVIL